MSEAFGLVNALSGFPGPRSNFVLKLCSAGVSRGQYSLPATKIEFEFQCRSLKSFLRRISREERVHGESTPLPRHVRVMILSSDEAAGCFPK